MKLIFTFYHFCILLFFSACSSEKKQETSFAVHEICGREFKSAAIYRVKAPFQWQFHGPEITENLSDTKKPLCEFFIQEDRHEIRITIHNFPSKTIEDRIPPSAQIIRWKRQFEEFNPLTVSTLPQSFGGFVGAFFEASGKIEGAGITMLCWSMQIAPEHYRRLSGNVSEQSKNEEIRSCYTIKAMGPVVLIEKNRKTIINFARSFELVNEI